MAEWCTWLGPTTADQCGHIPDHAQLSEEYFDVLSRSFVIVIDD